MVEVGTLSGLSVGLFIFYVISLASIYFTVKSSFSPKGSAIELAMNVYSIVYFLVITSLFVSYIGLYGYPEDEELQTKLSLWLWFVVNLVQPMIMLFIMFYKNRTLLVEGWSIWYIIQLTILGAILTSSITLQVATT